MKAGSLPSSLYPEEFTDWYRNRTGGALRSANPTWGMVVDVARSLVAEATAVNERRLIVLVGEQTRGYEAAYDAIVDSEIDVSRAIVVGRKNLLPLQSIDPAQATELLGTTHSAIIYDAHDALYPNTIGQITGTVKGGGLLFLCCPPFDSWPTIRDGFDETLAVPPAHLNDVTGYFRTRLISTLQTHPGIAITELGSGEIVRDGLTHPPEPDSPADVRLPYSMQFPRQAYEACLTQDQISGLRAFESIIDAGNSVVVEANRGRGKSSVAGLAAASLASMGWEVTITAPAFQNARAMFHRIAELLPALTEVATAEITPDDPFTRTPTGGSIRFVDPPEATCTHPDLLIVDEAAAIGVPILDSFLSLDRVAFCTTIHGYEGAGRGFSVRFRTHLDDSDLAVTTVTLTEPIRYAADDPIETWSFRALLLDASPPVDSLVTDATVDSVEYRRLTPSELLDDEQLLREVFGLLVLAHYRTEPNDLARLLDAPNISVRCLLHNGHVAAVALLAHEGGFTQAQCSRLYNGERIRGNMIPDILTSQLRTEDAGTRKGIRIMRIATHPAIRSRGLGSYLLTGVNQEFESAIDWVGVGYSATPELVSFWNRNGFSTIHLSTTRNTTSGEHSAIMLSPCSPRGQTLHDPLADWFSRRIQSVLSDALSELDADVVRAALQATRTDSQIELTDAEWRVVASAAYGPGLVDIDPRPFKALTTEYLIHPTEDLLTPRQERLLVKKILQGQPWRTVIDSLGFDSYGDCMRAIGTTLQPLVDRYGTKAAHAERDRYIT